VNVYFYTYIVEKAFAKFADAFVVARGTCNARETTLKIGISRNEEIREIEEEIKEQELAF